MTPRATQTRIKMLIAIMVFAVIVLVISVWVIAGRSNDKLKAYEDQQRQAQTEALRAGCERSVVRDLDLKGTNEDLAEFARDASVARLKDGNKIIAAKYAADAKRAEDRVVRIDERIPVNTDAGGRAAFCRQLFP